jgi:uncharacterized protein (DUF2336 family)
MSPVAEPASQIAQEDRPPSKARATLFKRLADVVCLPASRVNAFERAMTADLLVEMLRAARTEERAKVSARLAGLAEIPNALLRLLLRDAPEVARPILTESLSLTDSDLIGCARHAGPAHRLMIAQRRHVSEVVCDALVEAGEPAVVEAMLRNDGAKVGQSALEAICAATRVYPALIPALLKRHELRPAQAYVMFWWAEPDCRRLILQRFAVGREVLQDAASDVFAMAAADNWQDPLARKALQFIERRQRNRAAIDKSPYDSLEDAVAAAGASGLTRELAAEIAYLSGLKPMTGAKILTDPCGEPLAVLCKATGLPKSAIRALWKAMRRPEADSAGNMVPALERTLLIYDMMAVDRAQTVLRYWNWALSSALTPALLRAIRERDDEAVDDFSPSAKAAMLALQADFKA